MFEIINGMPQGTVGLSAKGAVSPADCEGTLVPLVAHKSAALERTPFLLLFGREFQDFSTEMLRDNVEFGFKHWPDFGRLAVVSDVDWLRKAVWLFAPFMRGNVRVFHDYEIEQAKTWVAS